MTHQLFTPETQEVIRELFSESLTLFNAFEAGTMESQILELRDALLNHENGLGGRLLGEVEIAFPEGGTLTVPLCLLGYLLAAGKQLGDMCSAYADVVSRQ